MEVLIDLIIISIIIGFILFVGVLIISIYEKICTAISSRKKDKLREKKGDEAKPIIRSRYMEVINEDYERRDEVINELAKSLGVKKGFVVGWLSSERIYKAKRYIDKSIEKQTVKKGKSMRHRKVQRSTKHVGENEMNIANSINGYCVVKGKTIIELEKEVKQKMSLGWKPYGGIAAAAFGISPVGGNSYVQAMVEFRKL